MFAAPPAAAKARVPPEKPAPEKTVAKPAPKPKQKLEGDVVVVDAGHGGKDHGMVVGGMREAPVVLEIAKRLGRNLRKFPGVSSFLTREDDSFVSLSGRVIKAEEVGGRAFVSLHIDNAWGRRLHGVVVYVYGKNDGIPPGPPREPGERMLPPPPKSQVSRSRRLAESIRLAVKAEGLRTVHYVDRGPFAVLKAPKIPSVLVELGNIRQKTHRARLADPKHQERLARAIAAGVKKFLAREKRRRARRKKYAPIH